ncbi:hypothetical protein HN51_017775 [Arachis hypogaea]|nr:uncharacterized protein DS421_8g223920 [Arachis hypogaea]
MASMKVMSWNNRNGLETVFHFLNVLAAVFLLSRSSLLFFTLQAFSYSLTLFNNPFYVFLLLNSIILSLYALSNNNNDVVTTAPQKVQTVTTVRSEGKQPPVDSNGTVTTVTTTRTMMCCRSRSMSVSSTNQKCYRRVRSERYERRVVAVGGGGRKQQQLEGRMCHVEHLNKEEFNRAVDDFIAKHKRMLWQEHTKSLSSSASSHYLPLK